ncbi:glutamine synthetase family protein [Parendozoicomonas haliclonae]|uniref:Gamma-glutamylputrescine synthetase PuuA n=1 Tax=Parendozoicomonas haliclonae TaxID=1960125 RepID=A0A1X7AR65_9GAMM|nr:glutamine synthetase family protein [Parendozoicomonas haliclonae]SMA50804.1 Gamma-glutamylputrescine synthetase PuuA [Parendozoicomonas haliclonae]
MSTADTQSAPRTAVETVDVSGWQDFLNRNAQVGHIDLLIADMNGVLRGKRIERDSLGKVFKNGVFLPGSVFALDIKGDTVEETGIGLEQGDFDCRCRPIPSSLTTVPWKNGRSAQLLMTMFDREDQPFFADPRQVLVKTLGQVESLGLTAVTAVEMEFYLVDKQRENGIPQPPVSAITGERDQDTQVYSMDSLDAYADFLAAVIAAAREQGLPADSIIAEYAPGQFEVNLHHVDNPVLACDQAILLKRVIRQVAAAQGMEATFMAKPYGEQAGSGMHVHISLLDQQGNNILINDDGSVSQALEHVVGGMLALMEESMALLAPNVNSYRRFRPEFYTPMAGTWGYDNRSTALRIPAGDPENTRVEYRVPGADANPYLVMAVILASVHYGLEQKIVPPPATSGNATKAHPPSLPDNLRDALRLLEGSDTLKAYLGGDFVALYHALRAKELANFERTVSQLEYELLLKTV